MSSVVCQSLLAVVSPTLLWAKGDLTEEGITQVMKDVENVARQEDWLHAVEKDDVEVDD